MNSRSGQLKRLARPLLLGLVALLGIALLGVANTARGAADRAQAASLDVTQTCTGRVQPQSRVDITATVTNNGDESLNITQIDADAGTDPVGDDFLLTFQSGDDGDGVFEPGEHWVYVGSFTAGTEDLVNTVGVDAVGRTTGTEVSDLAPCNVDVAQPPVAGKLFGVEAAAGKVLIKKPGGKFVALTGVTEIPNGSQIDTLHGTVALTAALGGGRTNTANFYQGVFKLTQAKANNAATTLTLMGGNFRGCAKKASTKALSYQSVSRVRRVRRLWGSGKGRFTTRGRYSSATVRGTKWLTQDQCNGTLTKVLQGVVRVKDFKKHRTVNVRAGHSYLAKAKAK